MPFDWYTADVPPIPERQRAAAMYERELTERAALLFRLGFPKAETRARLQAEVAWDFELHAPPPHAKRIRRIVDQVYAHKGGTGPGQPSL